MNTLHARMAIKFAGVAALLAAGLCTERVDGANIVSAGSGFWDVAATWSPAQVPTNTDNVTIGSTHTVTTRDIATHYAASITIQTNGVLTHSVNGSTEAYKVILNVASNLTIDLGGAINVDGAGYSANNGPGGATTGNAGGSYGGKGGIDASSVPPTTYGLITAPTNCGSGGNNSGASGGGAVLLTVGGTATVNGVISSAGSSTPQYSAGSGGSVFLTTGALAGNGTIRANGGVPTSSNRSGGGGRVAVILTNATSFDNVAMQAYGGNATYSKGAGGTIYLENTGNTPGHGKLIVDYNNYAPADRMACVTLQNGKDASSYAFSTIVLTNGAVYALDTNDTLDITSTTILASLNDPNRYNGIYVAGGTLTVPAAFAFSNYFIAIGGTSTTFNPTSLTVGTNGTLKVDAPFTLKCPMTVQPGGWLSHSANGSTEAYKINLTIGGDLNIQTGAQVNVDGLGYSANNGPGRPIGGGNDKAGSYGGMGGFASPPPTNPTYGSITAPTNCGSGGTDSSGGGAVLLTVNGTTTVNGLISARGSTAGTEGGAGGSVFLTTGVLAGNGTIQANGGDPTPTPYSSGGGGRVSVILTNSTSLDNVAIHAYGGAGVGWRPGAGGTVYLENINNTPGHGKLIVDYNNIAPVDRVNCVTMQNGKDPSSYAFSTIILTNGAVYGLDTNDTLDITSTTILTSTNDPSRLNGIYLAGGALTVPSVFAFSNYFIGIGATNATFNPTSLTVGTNATLKDDVPYTLNCPVTLQPGGWLRHSANDSTEAYKINLTINGNLNILTGAQVNADSLGYTSNNGPGRPTGSGSDRAASYGGMGGFAPPCTNPTYGSITAPINCGSGGGGSGTGGGVAILTVSGTTTVYGMISAGGSTSFGASGEGGSGGSVFLTTGALIGNGTIQANGGSPAGGYSSGGGGRIAVILTNSTSFDNVAMHAYGGTVTRNGAAGTVYQQTQAQGPGQGTLLIDAGNIVSYSPSITTLINSKVTDRLVGTVVITNKAIFQIDTNQSLTVNGSWTNRATFLAGTNSTVILAGANAATVTGSNTFWNLTCTSAVKTVYFEADRTNTVLGKITLANVTLNSTVNGQYTYLTLSTNGGSQQIGAVTVQDNNAGGGQQMLAGPRSANSGHNVNWKFPVSGTTFFFR